MARLSNPRDVSVSDNDLLTAAQWDALDAAVRSSADPVAVGALDRLKARFGRSAPIVLPEVDKGELEEHLHFELEYEALSGGASWRIIGDANDMARAAGDAGLDVNALRPADMPDEIMVEHPSAFCQDGALFLGILALLYQRGAPLRLYRCVSRPGGGDETLIRVFPEPGEETQAILRVFHPRVARHVSDLQERIHGAFDHFARFITDERA